MIIKFHKDFQKSYKKLNKDIQKKVDNSINRFRRDPFDKILKNHPLKGFLLGKRAFSVTNDIRIIFQEYDHYIYVFVLDVGSHAQIYSM